MSSISVLMSMIQKNKVAINNISSNVTGKLIAGEDINKRDIVSILSKKAIVKTGSSSGTAYNLNTTNDTQYIPRSIPYKYTGSGHENLYHFISASSIRDKNSLELWFCYVNEGSLSINNYNRVTIKSDNVVGCDLVKINDLKYILFYIYNSNLYFRVLTRSSTEDTVFSVASEQPILHTQGYICVVNAKKIEGQDRALLGLYVQQGSNRQAFAAVVESSGPNLSVISMSPRYYTNSFSSGYDIPGNTAVDVKGERVVFSFVNNSNNMSIVAGKVSADGVLTMGAEYRSSYTRQGRMLSVVVVDDDRIAYAMKPSLKIHDVNENNSIDSHENLIDFGETEFTSPYFFRSPELPDTFFLYYQSGTGSYVVRFEYDKKSRVFQAIKEGVYVGAPYYGSMVIADVPNRLFVASFGWSSISESKVQAFKSIVPIVSGAGIAMNGALKGEEVEVLFEGAASIFSGIVPGMNYSDVARGIDNETLFTVPFWEREE